MGGVLPTRGSMPILGDCACSCAESVGWMPGEAGRHCVDEAELGSRCGGAREGAPRQVAWLPAVWGDVQLGHGAESFDPATLASDPAMFQGSHASTALARRLWESGCADGRPFLGGGSIPESYGSSGGATVWSDPGRGVDGLLWLAVGDCHAFELMVLSDDLSHGEPACGAAVVARIRGSGALRVTISDRGFQGRLRVEMDFARARTGAWGISSLSPVGRALFVSEVEIPEFFRPVVAGRYYDGQFEATGSVFDSGGTRVLGGFSVGGVWLIRGASLILGGCPAFGSLVGSGLQVIVDAVRSRMAVDPPVLAEAGFVGGASINAASLLNLISATPYLTACSDEFVDACLEWSTEATGGGTGADDPAETEGA